VCTCSRFSRVSRVSNCWIYRDFRHFSIARSVQILSSAPIIRLRKQVTCRRAAAASRWRGFRWSDQDLATNFQADATPRTCIAMWSPRRWMFKYLLVVVRFV
jgi:hypothetical protein